MTWPIWTPPNVGEYGPIRYSPWCVLTPASVSMMLWVVVSFEASTV